MYRLDRLVYTSGTHAHSTLLDTSDLPLVARRRRSRGRAYLARTRALKTSLWFAPEGPPVRRTRLVAWSPRRGVWALSCCSCSQDGRTAYVSDMPGDARTAVIGPPEAIFNVTYAHFCTNKHDSALSGIASPHTLHSSAHHLNITPPAGPRRCGTRRDHIVGHKFNTRAQRATCGRAGAPRIRRHRTRRATPIVISARHAQTPRARNAAADWRSMLVRP